MKVKLYYGRKDLIVNFSENIRVLSTKFLPGVVDETQAIRDALHNPIGSLPLAELVRRGKSVAIAHTDITRATPNSRILPVLLNELEVLGINRKNITLINSLGTHRKQSEGELREMLGDEIVKNYICIQHDAFNDKRLIDLGKTSLGHRVSILKDFIDADIRILTGLIEPHFFAGFSGGPKGVLPALAGAESIFSNHGYSMIAHPNATWGITEGNPVWEEMREVALLTKPTFLINVTLNSLRQITGVFAGDLLEAHSAGCGFVRKNSMVPVDTAFDIVITTNSGYPLDQNLYQSSKGMSGASQIVREGGTIIIATACEDGLPNYGQYKQLLSMGGSPQGTLDMIASPGFKKQDQWVAQIQAMIQLKANVYVYSDGLTDSEIKQASLIPCRNLKITLASLKSKYGHNARICVIPDGPQVIAFLTSNT